MNAPAKQRFVELDVDEISTVDTPANNRKFVVLKRLAPEGEEMDPNKGTEQEKVVDAKAQTEATVQKEESNKPEIVKLEVEKAVSAHTAALLDALANLNGLSETDVEKAAGAKDTIKSQLLKMGLSPLQADQMMKMVDKMVGGKDKMKTAKSSDEEQDSASVLLGTLEEAVRKAKTFTPKRAATLKDLVTKLGDFIKDLESAPATSPIPESINAASGSPATSEEPKGVQASGAVTAEAASVTKAMEDAIAKALQPVNELVATTKSLGERLEKIEKSRASSTSADDQGGTEGSTVQKSTSLFSGVL